MRLLVVGGGLAGIAAALDAADAGCEVTLLERRGHLGGLATSFERGGHVFDNGQHVFLRCCTEYRALLDRLGAGGLVRLQRRCDVPVLSPDGRTSAIRRSWLPAPLHLAGTLLAYRHLSIAERVRAGACALALRGLDGHDPSLDDVTFSAWLEAHGQSPRAIERLWNLIAMPTINLHASEASLALAAKVFRTGLLEHRDAGDVGWASVPLRTLHDECARAALEHRGVDVQTQRTARRLESAREGVRLWTEAGIAEADAVIVATPPSTAAALGALQPEVAGRLGASPIVNVHLVFDRQVTDLEFFAAIDAPAQFVFDRTAATGIASGQCLAVTVSGADAQLSIPSKELVASMHRSLGELLPSARAARLVDAVVTRERAATFRGVPGTARLRPSARTASRGVYLAGAWCDTGWPATMEGAVRSGREAAAAALADHASDAVDRLVGSAA